MLSLGDTLVFDFHPWKIILGVGLMCAGAVLYRRTVPPLPRMRRWALASLRVLGFALLALLVLDPVAVSVRTDVQRPLVLVLFDASRSMSLPDGGGVSRRDRAARALRRFIGSMHERCDAAIEAVPFSNVLFPGPVGVDSLPPAVGDGTDIEGALSVARARYRSRNLNAVILMSDGRMTRAVTGRSAWPSPPVYAVGFGDTLEQADIAVERVRYDRIVYAGTKAEIEAVVEAQGFSGQTAVVRLEEGDAVLDDAELRLEAGRAEYTVPLSFTPRSAGERRLSVRVIAPPGDRRAENDAESIRVRVLKEKVRILFVDQHADWNAAFLGDLARRSPRLDLETVVWTTGRGFRTLADGRAWEAPASTAEFERYDLVILADDSGVFATAPRIAALRRYLEEGGALLLLADEHSPLCSPAPAERLAPLLPVVLRGPVIIETGEYTVAVGRGSSTHPLAAVFLEAARGEGPPPLAARLANIDVTAEAQTPLVLRDGNGEYPFCALARRGRGAAAVVLGFPLWRWRLAGEEGDVCYDDFLGGLIQYLADGFDAPTVDVMTDRTVYRAGDVIGVTACVRDPRGVDGLRGEVLRSDQGEERVERTFLFEPERGRIGYYRAELESVEPGEYRITAEEIRGERAGSSGKTGCSVQPVSVEFVTTSRDNGFLRSLVRATGGALIESDAIGTLPARIDCSVESRQSLERLPLRRSPWFFAAILVVFAAEWVLRKAWGLV